MAWNFEFNVSYKDIFYNLIPQFLRKNKFLAYLYAIAKPIQTISNDLRTKTQEMNTFLNHSSQVIYFEKYLNDKYDPLDRRITITNKSTEINYWFNDVESAAAVYMYNLWNGTTAYVVDERIVFDNVIYKCILGHTGVQPPHATYWTSEGTMDYYYNLGGGSLEYDFVVNVPNSLVYVDAEFRGDIEQYKLAGKTYEIVKS